MIPSKVHYRHIPLKCDGFYVLSLVLWTDVDPAADRDAGLALDPETSETTNLPRAMSEQLAAQQCLQVISLPARRGNM